MRNLHVGMWMPQYSTEGGERFGRGKQQPPRSSLPCSPCLYLLPNYMGLQQQMEPSGQWASEAAQGMHSPADVPGPSLIHWELLQELETGAPCRQMNFRSLGFLFIETPGQGPQLHGWLLAGVSRTWTPLGGQLLSGDSFEGCLAGPTCPSPLAFVLYSALSTRTLWVVGWSLWRTLVSSIPPLLRWV